MAFCFSPTKVSSIRKKNSRDGKQSCNFFSVLCFRSDDLEQLDLDAINIFLSRIAAELRVSISNTCFLSCDKAPFHYLLREDDYVNVCIGKYEQCMRVYL